MTSDKFMSETGREAPPEAKKEAEKKLNWHLTELPSGAWSVGTTFDEAGFYPADEERGTADALVAPADFVDKYLKEHDEEHEDGAIREAIERWRDEQKIYDDVLHELGYTREVLDGFSVNDRYAADGAIEDTILERKIEDLLLHRTDENPVFIKRSDGSFSRMTSYREQGYGQIKVYFESLVSFESLRKTVDSRDLLNWQIEGRAWLREKSRTIDERKGKISQEIERAIPAILNALATLQAKKVEQKEKEYQSYRYAPYGWGKEQDIRKSSIVVFVIGEEQFSLAGTVNTYGYDHDAGVNDEGDDYYQSWSMYTVKDSKLDEFVGHARSHEQLIEHLKRWVAGDKKSMNEGKVWEK